MILVVGTDLIEALPMGKLGAVAAFVVIHDALLFLFLYRMYVMSRRKEEK